MRISAYREHVKCKGAAANAQKQLARARAEKSIKEVEYQSAVDALKRLLLKAMTRLGLATTVVAVDAAADLYLAGKAAKDGISGGQSSAKTVGDPSRSGRGQGRNHGRRGGCPTKRRPRSRGGARRCRWVPSGATP